MREEFSEFDLNDGKGEFFFFNEEAYGAEYIADVEPDYRKNSELVEAIPQRYVEGSWVDIDISDEKNPDQGSLTVRGEIEGVRRVPLREHEYVSHVQIRQSSRAKNSDYHVICEYLGDEVRIEFSEVVPDVSGEEIAENHPNLKRMVPPTLKHSDDQKAQE